MGHVMAAWRLTLQLAHGRRASRVCITRRPSDSETMQFDQLGLAEPILRAVRAAGYSTPTPIQTQAIPPLLEGRDLLGCAQTGTGKTAAFALPILQRLTSAQPAPQAQGRQQRRPDIKIRTLIVAPTRELAAQIGDSFNTYGRYLPLRTAVIFGGVSQVPQVAALRRGIDILVATPGRLLDLMDQGHIHINGIEVLVLDEADRMLDMGFINDIRKIIARVPQERQTLMFSATMPGEIRSLANGLLREPVYVSVAPDAPAAQTVDQRVYLVERDDKLPLLTHLLRDDAMTRTLVFTRTKHGADRVAKRLVQDGIDAAAIHGNKSQNARLRALDGFKRGQTRVLVASDIASRGLDIDEVSHVINFDVPNEPETYVHRIGRTGRAGASGMALAFCAGEERGFLRSIERLMGVTVPVERDNPFHATFHKMDSDRPHVPERQRPRAGQPGRPGQSARQPHATRQPQSPRSAHGEQAPRSAHAEQPAWPARSEHARHTRAEHAGRPAHADQRPSSGRRRGSY
jgi:ATP-dependent RNA helicase RhlE